MLDVAIRRPLKGFTLDVAFSYEARGVTALYGRSGAGKSSVILAVAGLLPGVEGRIALNGRVLLDSKAGVNLPTRKRRVGVVFQEGRLFPHLSVRGNLLYGARRAKSRSAENAAPEFDHVVSLLGIGDLLGRRPASLSGGERQRVALGRALLSAPDLLAMDEPLAALDPARKAEILPYLERLRDETDTPILYVSHSVDEIARLADRVVALEQGRVAAAGSLEDVFAGLGLHGAGGEDSCAIVAATVAADQTGDGLTDLDLGQGARLAAPALSAPPGARVHVQIRARDVTLALDPPTRISANNVLPVTVTEIAPQPASDLVLLDCAGRKLNAEITKRAALRLGLKPGMAAYAIIKTVTIAR